MKKAALLIFLIAVTGLTAGYGQGILEYPFHSGCPATDTSGNSYDGSVIGPGNFTRLDGIDGAGAGGVVGLSNVEDQVVSENEARERANPREFASGVVGLGAAEGLANAGNAFQQPPRENEEDRRRRK